MASSDAIGVQSLALSLYGVWCTLYQFTFAAVITSSGYSYFGTVLLFTLCSSSSFAFIASDSSGHDSSTVPSFSMFVTNDVFTDAPFSYVIDVSHTMWSHLMTLLRDARHVSVGANRKNGMPRSR